MVLVQRRIAGASQRCSVRRMAAVVVAACCLAVVVVDAKEVAREACAEARTLIEREAAVAHGAMKPLTPPIRASTPRPHIYVGGCDVVELGWWSYELCPGKWIRQFHKEHEAVASEFYLGFGAHALAQDAIGTQTVRYRDHASTVVQQIMRDDGLRGGVPPPSDDAHRARCRKTTTPAHPHQVVVDYVGGTVCDATKQPRRTVVVYVCAHAPLFSWNITERSCVYTVFVVGTMACRMMEVAPPPTASPTPSTAPRDDGTQRQQKPPGAPPPSTMDVRPHPGVRRKLHELAERGGDARIPTPVRKANPTQPEADEQTPSVAEDSEAALKRTQEAVVAFVNSIKADGTAVVDGDATGAAQYDDGASSAADGSEKPTDVLDERGEPFDFGDAMVFSV